MCNNNCLCYVSLERFTSQIVIPLFTAAAIGEYLIPRTCSFTAMPHTLFSRRRLKVTLCCYEMPKIKKKKHCVNHFVFIYSNSGRCEKPLSAMRDCVSITMFCSFLFKKYFFFLHTHTYIDSI